MNRYVVVAFDAKGTQYLVGQYTSLEKAVEIANAYRAFYNDRIVQIKSPEELR